VAKAQFGYTGDDLTLYQLAWESANEAPAAGNLPAAVALSATFPCLWRPRHLVATRTTAGVVTTARCVCQPTNAAYLSGPGATITIGGLVYTVTSCVGEDRQDA